MAPLRHADLPMKIGFQGQSGSNADIAKMTRLTLSGHKPRYRPPLARRRESLSSWYTTGHQVLASGLEMTAAIGNVGTTPSNVRVRANQQT
jgi:hypothetical protein